MPRLAAKLSRGGRLKREHSADITSQGFSLPRSALLHGPFLAQP